MKTKTVLNNIFCSMVYFFLLFLNTLFYVLLTIGPRDIAGPETPNWSDWVIYAVPLIVNVLLWGLLFWQKKIWFYTVVAISELLVQLLISIVYSIFDYYVFKELFSVIFINGLLKEGYPDLYLLVLFFLVSSICRIVFSTIKCINIRRQNVSIVMEKWALTIVLFIQILCLLSLVAVFLVIRL